MNEPEWKPIATAPRFRPILVGGYWRDKNWCQTAAQKGCDKMELEILIVPKSKS